MAQTYAALRRAKAEQGDTVPAVRTSEGPSLAALQGGAMPSQEQLGGRISFTAAMQSKMEKAFGMDFSGVQLHESQTVADAGADAVTMGRHIAFAPGKLSAPGGQELLGHELSHVASQARGEVSGRGFLRDSALEARADREGAMAAAGESVYTGPMTPISSSSVTPAAGPMQARKTNSKKEMLRQGFDQTKGLSKNKTSSEDPAFLMGSIIGTKDERREAVAQTADPQFLAGMASAKLTNAESLGGLTKQKKVENKIQTDRIERRIGHKQGGPIYTDPTETEAGFRADAFGGENNDRIKGNVFSPAGNKNNGKHVILYSGSSGRNLNQMQGNIQKYLEEGYTVHSYDYGGFGDSEGEGGMVSEASINEDAQAIYDHVLAGIGQNGESGKAKDVLLHGFSLGGSMASMVARNAAIKAAKSGNEDDKLGGLVLESAIKNTTDAASTMMPVVGALGGAIGTAAYGGFDTEANLDELSKLDSDMPITFISGGADDHLSDKRTGLSKKAEKKFNNVQKKVLSDKDHMATDKLSASWKDIKDKLWRRPARHS